MAETPNLVHVTRIIYVWVAVFLAATIIGSLIAHDQDPIVRIVQVDATTPRAGNAGNTQGPATTSAPTTTWANGSMTYEEFEALTR